MTRDFLLGMLLLATTAMPCKAGSPARFTYDEAQMGAPWRITLYAPDEDTANRAARAAYGRIAELNRVLSDYDPHSELSRLATTAGSGRAIPLGDDLWNVLERSQRLSVQSGGAFDITVGPLSRLWRRARRQREMPRPDLLAAARKSTGHQHLRLDPKHHTAELAIAGMRLDPGGIGMGYAVDEALQVLKKHGIVAAMIDASGDIGTLGAPPGATGWRIGIAPLSGDGPPSQYVVLRDKALTISGDAFQAVEIDGKRYSHIVDPRTGLGLTERSAVTVIANDCTTADSHATAASVLGPKEGIALIESTPGAAALIVRQAADGQIETIESRDFPKHVADCENQHAPPQ